jgi:hypothetical protein
MKVYLAGTQGDKGGLTKGNTGLYLLESFEYLNDEKIKMYGKHNFLLDSGAFTFMNKKSGNVDWQFYIKRYGEFIKKHDIKLFFELDIDSIVGLKEVERLRNKLELIAERKCIPVWHKSRGLEYWKKMIKEYDYVAIGGIVTREIKRNEHKIFSPLLKIAKENNCKVHGLGYTNLKGLKKYPFYSVDSTSWISGQKFLNMMQYIGNGEFKTHRPKKGQKGINPKKRLEYNFNEWVKFQKYAEREL